MLVSGMLAGKVQSDLCGTKGAWLTWEAALDASQRPMTVNDDSCGEFKAR